MASLGKDGLAEISRHWQRQRLERLICDLYEWHRLALGFAIGDGETKTHAEFVDRLIEHLPPHRQAIEAARRKRAPI